MLTCADACRGGSSSKGSSSKGSSRQGCCGCLTYADACCGCLTASLLRMLKCLLPCVLALLRMRKGALAYCTSITASACFLASLLYLPTHGWKKSQFNFTTTARNLFYNSRTNFAYVLFQISSMSHSFQYRPSFQYRLVSA